MKQIDFNAKCLAIKKLEYNALLDALKEHGNYFAWEDDEERPIIPASIYRPFDFMVNKVIAIDGQITLYGEDAKSYGEEIIIKNISDVFTGHLSDTLDYLPKV